ncbi:MAG: hypothetical protein JO044_19595 [Mycobacteriaceae bacterium]|nr:hypothetical protein [Mycobacteriaceae bacterium]MBV9641838.1 hypothetical protein [Mycobacteriaceae bacterium]
MTDAVSTWIEPSGYQSIEQNNRYIVTIDQRTGHPAGIHRQAAQKAKSRSDQEDTLSAAGAGRNLRTSGSELRERH